MAEVFPRDVLLRVGGRTLHRLGVLAAAGAGRGYVEIKETFTRADPGTEIDRDGIIRLAAANVPRIEWWDLDGDGIKEPYYLHEGSSRTNAWDRSEELDHANWTKIGATITPNATTAPDNTVTADQCVESALNEAHGFNRATPTLTDNTKQSVFVHAKYTGTRAWFRIKTTPKSGAGGAASSWFNVQTGALGTVAAGHTAQIRKLGTGGYRCAIEWDALSGATAPVVEVYMATADATGNYAGDGTSGMAFWGMQFEVDQAFPSSYIKTVAAAATRGADSLTVLCNFGQIAMSVFTRFGERGSATSNSGAGPVLFGTGSVPFSRFDTFGTAYRFSNQQVAGAVASVTSAAPAIGQETKLLGVIFPDGSVKTSQSIAGGADTGGAQSGAQALTGLWSSQLLTVGGGGWHGLLGDALVVRDARSLAEMAAVP
jgi:hypothetical protein